MITAQDKIDLLARIVEIEDMNLCSTEFIKKVTSPTSTSSDKVLDNYPNNGNIKLDNCFVCIDRNYIGLSGVVEFYSEEFDYRDEDKIGKRFIGYCHNQIKIVESNFAIINSLKLFFLVCKTNTSNILKGVREPKDFNTMFYPLISKLDDYDFNENFYNKTLMINWTTFKKICEQVPVADDWTEWFDYNIKNMNSIKGW